MSEPLQAEIRGLGPWFHNLHLPDGSETCPEHELGDFPSFKWRAIAPHLPADLHGWSALDVGCNAGFYSFELARRGAKVTALDSDPHYLRQARWAARLYGLESGIEFQLGQIYELASARRRWDLVLFMGVLYHLRYPLLGLDIVARCVERLLVVQSLTMPGTENEQPPLDLPLDQRERLCAPGWPKMAFVERDLAGDCTNWWAPNQACLEAMLRSTGFSVSARPAHEVLVCRPDPQTPSNMWRWNEQEFLAATGLSGRNGERR